MSLGGWWYNNFFFVYLLDAGLKKRVEIVIVEIG
jgi:hypothetical protein